MLRSLYSGISGMRANQTKQDVIGNNIANVGTTSFKASRARFQDMLSQSAGEATAPSSNQGGINGSQIGLGVQLAGIDTITKTGMMQPTSRNADLAIDGEGYFIVGKGGTIFEDGEISVNQSVGTHNIDSNSLSKSSMDVMYTRDGAFTLDSDGNLLTSDGYRVMGYSLTNDSTLSKATTQAPNSVAAAGLTFQFGPGAALNGYHIELGTVGAGTMPSANVDKESKKIIVNGDFATVGALKGEDVQTAINKGLSVAGIAQTLTVSGNPTIIKNIVSPGVTGGADDKAPATVSSGGFTFDFSAGDSLNGYTVELATVSTGTATSASVDKNLKKIFLSGDFVTPNAVTANAVKNAVNQGLSNAGISQVLTSVSGSSANINGLSGLTDNVGSIPVVPSIGAVAPLSSTTLGGFTLGFGYGGQLNDYKIKLGTTSALTTTSVSVDTTSKIVTINGDFTVTDPTAKSTLADQIKTKVNAALSMNNISQPVLKTVTVPAGNLTTTDNLIQVTGGKDLSSPASVEVGGLDFAFNNGKTFNGYTVELGKVSAGTTLGVTVNPTTKKITIDADFITPNAFSTSQLQTALDAAVASNIGAGAGQIDPATVGKVDANGVPIAGTAADIKITVTGSPKNITGVSSRQVDGGTKLVAPGVVSTAGFNFQMTPGGALNDYKFVVGNIAAGTPTSASVDTAHKTIVINGDFTMPNIINVGALQTAINNALSNKGVSQAVSVTGQNISINDIKSNVTNGGTPVQSIKANGVVSFVDGTKVINAYDGSLKSLRIPETIHDDASNTDLKVRTFSVGKDGVVSAVLEDGRVSAIGQLAMASFRNPAGLNKLGKNLYHASVNSGEPTLRSGINTNGEDNSKGYGDALQGMLEMSNVDLAEQFTDMIVTSRAFQASSKVITTGDEILQDILNLKR